MAGWGKLVAGAVIGIAGTVYATNDEIRKQLPKSARDLPDAVRRRFGSAVTAAREASSSRREEILRDLESHGEDHSARPANPRPPVEWQAETAPEEAVEQGSSVDAGPRGPLHEDDTQQIYRPREEHG
ncbi:hypothetical protein BH24ACT22_BH24ACT22_18570 [soil metagenome]